MTEIYIFSVEQGKLDSALAGVDDNLAWMRQLGLEPSAAATIDKLRGVGAG